MILESILYKNFMKYKIEELISIWRLVLLKNHGDNYEQLRQFRLKYGYQEILKQGVKVTDLQRKDRLFELACENIKLIYGQGHKDLLIAISQSYFRIFQKMLIYEKNYVSVVRTLLQIFNSKQKKDQGKVQELLPNLSQQTIYMILTQIETILINTIAKPFHLLHRQCLLTLALIAEQYATSKSEKTNYLHVKNSATKILKSIQTYLYRKPVRDEARKAYQTWKIVQNGLKKLHQEKMEKIKQSVVLSLINGSKSEKNSQPVFIDDVLRKANNYQSKYNVPIIDNSRYIGKSGLFLKKGQGVGGGKAELQDSPEKVIRKQRRYQEIVQNCLSGNQKSSVRFPIIQQMNQIEMLQKKRKITQSPVKRANYYNFENGINGINQETTKSLKQTMRNESQYSQSLEEDAEYNQICDLIDLAYNYKFAKEAN